jgi:hypothetical protein
MSCNIVCGSFQTVSNERNTHATKWYRMVTGFNNTIRELEKNESMGTINIQHAFNVCVSWGPLTHDTLADNPPPFCSRVQASAPEPKMSLDLPLPWTIEITNAVRRVYNQKEFWEIAVVLKLLQQTQQGLSVKELICIPIITTGKC